MNQVNTRLIGNKYTKIIFGFVFVVIAILMLRSPKAYAAYDGARIIDNQIFLDANSMNAAQIQQFLVDKGAGLASRNFVLTCGAPSDTATMRVYAAVNAPCGQTVPASTIIFYASQIYGVSPRVTLATMQKEQSLTTAANPTDWQINQAMGYGCPDSGGCGSSNFFYQIDNGVWALRYHYERANSNNTWWNNGGNVCGSATVYRSTGLYAGATVTFKDDNGVGYATYTLANAATASFYCYTPHAYNNPQGLYGLPAMGTVGMYYSGSYNFVLWFERWFGATQLPNYAWQYMGQEAYMDDTKTLGVDTNNLAQNTRYYVVLKARNVGNTNWIKGTVKLGTFNISDRYSQFYDSSWINTARPTTISEDTVAPGDTATFAFWVKSPNTTGTFKEYFNPVVDGVTWMNDLGMNYLFKVNPTNYTWQYVGQDAYLDDSKNVALDTNNLAQNTRYYVVLKARNASNIAWVKNTVKLGTFIPSDRYSQFYDSSWINTARPATITESQVLPGQVATFGFWIKSPSASGLYTEYFDPVVDGVTWMNSLGMHFPLKVNTANYSWQYVTQEVYTDDTKTTVANVNSLNPSTRYYAVFKGINKGNKTWDPAILNVATLRPGDRTSLFYDSTWAKVNRPATVTGPVRPGETATFGFWIKTPAAAGTYKEYFGLVEDGFAWLNDPGLHYVLTIH